MLFVNGVNIFSNTFSRAFISVLMSRIFSLDHPISPRQFPLLFFVYNPWTLVAGACLVQMKDNYILELDLDCKKVAQEHQCPLKVKEHPERAFQTGLIHQVDCQQDRQVAVSCFDLQHRKHPGYFSFLDFAGLLFLTPLLFFIRFKTSSSVTKLKGFHILIYFSKTLKCSLLAKFFISLRTCLMASFISKMSFFKSLISESIIFMSWFIFLYSLIRFSLISIILSLR